MPTCNAARCPSTPRSNRRRSRVYYCVVHHRMEVGSNSKYSSEPSLVVNGVRAGSKIGVFGDVAMGPFLRMIGAPTTTTRPAGLPGQPAKPFGSNNDSTLLLSKARVGVESWRAGLK
jgi:hypothetical protein